MTLAELESIAQQLAARVRDDNPDANLRWLRAELGTDPNAPISDVEQLVILLAIAYPYDRTWKQATAWTRRSPVDSPVDDDKRRRMRRVA